MNRNIPAPAPDRRISRQARVTAEHEREASVLKRLFEARKRELGLTQNSLGHDYDIGNQAAVWQFMNAKVPLSMKAARGFARGLRCELAEFSPRLAREAISIGATVQTSAHSSASNQLRNISDTVPSGSADQRPTFAGKVSLSRRVPIIGVAKLLDGGSYREEPMGGVDGYVQMQTLDAEAYGLRVRGDQMAPAIRDGWFVVVSPGSAPALGEYVAIELKNSDKIIRELLYSRDDSVSVVEVNGMHRQTIPREDISVIHAIAYVVSPSQWVAKTGES
jgi:phage repressor protein C with HTH and peptisase S24 domain